MTKPAVMPLTGFALLLGGCSPKTAQFLGGVVLSPTAMMAAQIVTAAVMTAGLFGLLTFVIPGLTVIWLAALAYGLLTGFTVTGWIFFVLITLLMIFGNVIDQLMMGAKARKSGASWSGVVLSTIAAFIFSFLFPPFGGILAALIVLFTFEFIRLRDWRKAGGATGEMAVGCATAMVARFLIGLVMIGLWVVWVWQSGKLPF